MLASLFNQVRQQLASDHTLATSTHTVEAYDGTDYRTHVRFTPGPYTRNKVFEEADLSLWVLCWKPGDASPIHNHPQQGCILKVLQGSLVETRYPRTPEVDLSTPTTTILRTGATSYLDDHQAVHEIQATEETVTLHLYAPGYFQPTLYS